VLSGDGKQSYGIFFTLAAERLTPAPQPEVRFMETPAGAPPAIKQYWNAGETVGPEFIYPKEQARRLAKNTKEGVLTTQSETKTTAETNTANLTRLSADGRETKVDVGSKPTASAPTGQAQQGEPAPQSIEVPVIVVTVIPREFER
jgi:hypothetical protein